jgi:two-component system chemotaxis response regulator CheB
LHPNVITLDLQMPGMNGIDTLKEIMRRHPLPVIVVSSHSTDGASVTVKALGLGAFDFVTKPQDASAHMADTTRELIAKIKAAADCKMVRPGFLRGAPESPEKISAGKSALAPTKIVAIGISTGGPQALEFLLAQLPPDFPGMILVVQHMPEGFTEMFARRLNELSALRVKEAHSGDLLQAGRVLISPGSRHMKVKRLLMGDVVVLNDDALGVLMTGMGEDGALGLGAMKKAGGMTIAQSEESCVVYGMPKAAIERGYATRVVGLDVLSSTLQALCGRNEGHAEGAGAGKAIRAGR